MRTLLVDFVRKADTINVASLRFDRAERRASSTRSSTEGNDMDGDGISVKKWAAGKSVKHKRALGLLTVDDVKVLRRGLSAKAKIAELQLEVDEMSEIEVKLDRIVASSGDAIAQDIEDDPDFVVKK